GRLAALRAWLRHPPPHSADLARRVADSAGVALSRALSPRASGLDRVGLGRVREQAESQVLSLDGIRPSSSQRRSRLLEALFRGDRSSARRRAGGCMSPLPRLRSFLSALVRRRRLEADMETEWRAHLDAHVDALVASGMSPADAQRRARMDFGDPLRW